MKSGIAVACPLVFGLLSPCALAQSVVTPTLDVQKPAQAQPPDAKTPPDRPSYFGLYPPPPSGNVTPGKPPASTASRRPNLFDPVSVYPSKDNWLFEGALDWRFRKSSKQTTGTYIAGGRFTMDYIRASNRDGDERGGARIQVVAEPNNPSNTTLKRLRASEFYGFYQFKFPGVAATVKGGQFVLPFGLAAVYDTPLQPIQPLYNQSLGLRVDTGVMLEGIYGPYRYLGSVTTGSGPNRSDFDGNKTIAFRLERHFLTQSGRIQFGGSMLTGRGPVTTSQTELPVSGTSGARDFVDKSRFGVDVQYLLDNLTARGEIVFGADDQKSVYGYFGEADYGIGKRVMAIGMIKRWSFSDQGETLTVLGAGINFDLGYGITLRSLYEYQRAVPPGSGAATVDHRLTLQTKVSF